MLLMMVHLPASLLSIFNFLPNLQPFKVTFHFFLPGSLGGCNTHPTPPCKVYHCPQGLRKVWWCVSKSETPEVILRCFLSRGSCILVALSLWGVARHTYIRTTQVCLLHLVTVCRRNLDRACGSSSLTPHSLPHPIFSCPQCQQEHAWELSDWAKRISKHLPYLL